MTLTEDCRGLMLLCILVSSVLCVVIFNDTGFVIVTHYPIEEGWLDGQNWGYAQPSRNGWRERLMIRCEGGAAHGWALPRSDIRAERIIRQMGEQCNHRSDSSQGWDVQGHREGLMIVVRSKFSMRQASWNWSKSFHNTTYSVRKWRQNERHHGHKTCIYLPTESPNYLSSCRLVHLLGIWAHKQYFGRVFKLKRSVAD